MALVVNEDACYNEGFFFFHGDLACQSTRTLTIDYRCEDGSFFLVFTSCVVFSNPDSLSSSETGVNLRIESREKHLSE
jgi:hypothetical protein